MNNFIYDIPVRVYFGRNQLCHLGEELSKYGNRVLLTYGGGSIKKTGLYDKVMQVMGEAGMEVFELSGIEPNPRIESVRKGAQICKDNNVDVILAVGGGSTIDASKWIAAGACADFDPWLFFSENRQVQKALPLMTVLTLAATGSEMDPIGVISNMETKDKIGKSSPLLFPKVSFLDPEATYTVSKYQTACGSTDMISHILEVYFNMEPDLEMLDYFMEGMLKTVIKYAPVAMKEPENYEARANLMWVSSWAINGFINGGKRLAWSCHPLEHTLSAFYDITHGHGLAIVTPRWMEYCLDETTVSRYVRFATNVFGISPEGEPMTVARKGIDALADFFFGTLGLQKTFGQVGIKEEDIPAMAAKVCEKGAIKGFKLLAKEDVEKIYRMCL